jgi:hypothetical protein
MCNQEDDTISVEVCQDSNINKNITCTFKNGEDQAGNH